MGDMSTEARAPGEDVEGLAARLEEDHLHDDGGSCWCYLDIREEAAATLRDLSRKLEEAKEASRAYMLDAIEWAAKWDAAEAALEEARRERDEWIENHRIVAGSYNMAVEENERYEEALREVLGWLDGSRWTPGTTVEGAEAMAKKAARRALSPQPQEPATEGEEP